MTIPINISELTLQQVVKLFSNPVPGITCQIDGLMKDIKLIHNYNEIINNIQNIRYSKSMILKALKFWHGQMWNYYKKISRINNPLDPNTSKFKDQHSPTLSRKVLKQCNDILQTARLISKLPDTFLFSHRHIEIKSKKYNNSMNTQLELLNKKYPYLKVDCKEYGFQENILHPVFKLTMDVGIEFTVFPCEHPYIKRQKISKVGITEKGNVYIIHGEKRE
ncbi:MAG: hypothetical protein ACHQ1D_10960 [Nitrososphaerales archaeon]